MRRLALLASLLTAVSAAAPPPAVKPATIGRIPFAPCPASDKHPQALCGAYEVFENRDSRKGRKLALNIMVLPALAAEPEPDAVFLLAGGPGEGAVQAYPLAGYVALLRARRHVVLVDQRGTGKSNPLPCAVKTLDSVQSMVGDSWDLDKLRACRADLEKRADLTQYTTSIFADDLDEVRDAMGFPRIDVFGGSYGAEAALVYLRRHDDHVRAVALKAVKPVNYKLPLMFSKTIQASVERLLAGQPKLAEDFHAILDELSKSPARFEAYGGRKVTLSREAFISDLRLLLYAPQLAAQLPRFLHEAAQHNWQPFTSSYYLVNRQVEPEIARGLSFSVLCAEDVPATTEDEIRRETAGTWLGDHQVRQYQAACKLWPRGAAPRDFFDPVRSDKPVLLIAGENDPATPIELARDAARTLPNSRVVALPGGTHLTQSACIDNLIAKFIDAADTRALAACPANQ